MVMSALNTKLIRELYILRAQTITTAILIMSGVSLLISSWSSYHSLSIARDQYYRDYKFASIFAEFKSAPLEIANELSSVVGVNQIDARILIDGLVTVKSQVEPAVGRFISIPSGKQPHLNQMFLKKGRLPLESNEIEVVVHEGFASAHQLNLGDQLIVTIQGQRETVRIVGVAISPEFVYALSPAAPLPDDLHFGVFWIPRKPLERLAKLNNQINSVVLSVDPSVSIHLIKNNLDLILKNYGNRGVYDRKRQLSNMFVEDEISQQKAAIVITPLVFLTTAAFLIHIILTRLVAIHRPQIATLKSLGYFDREITFHYLKLIFLMAMIGALPGVLIGSWLGTLMTASYKPFFHFPNLNFIFSFDSALVGYLSGILPALLGGYTSLISVYRLTPMDAMRPPLPPSYQNSLLEKFGVWTRANIQKRMVWRNLFIKPIRLFFTVLGISAALGIVVTAHAWSDMIHYLLQTQFQRIQREDMSVFFIKPISESGIHELSKVKGVMSVEAYRSIPVRIVFKNYNRELLLTGYPSSPQMIKKLDVHFKPILVPDNGILLSRFFEKSWNLRVGDLVSMETLEGELRTVTIPVVGFSDDLVGLSASMQIHTLWNFFHEQSDYNFANVKIDSHHVTEGYVEIKNLPFVATLILKQQLYRGFQKTMGGMIGLSTFILTLFALLIAMGVIYNSIRISFSERSWEMASLRVLGFGQNSVFAMLSTEVATQIILAIFPGCWIGYALVHFTMKSIHTETFGFPVVMNPDTYSTSVLIILGAFLISNFVIFKMIKKLSLIEALKVRE